MDDRTREFVETFQLFLRDVVNQNPAADDRLTPFGELVEEHLGEPIRRLPVVTHLVAPHRLVDLDLASHRSPTSRTPRPAGSAAGSSASTETCPSC